MSCGSVCRPAGPIWVRQRLNSTEWCYRRRVCRLAHPESATGGLPGRSPRLFFAVLAALYRAKLGPIRSRGGPWIENLGVPGRGLSKGVVCAPSLPLAAPRTGLHRLRRSWWSLKTRDFGAAGLLHFSGGFRSTGGHQSKNGVGRGLNSTEWCYRRRVCRLAHPETATGGLTAPETRDVGRQIASV